METDFPIMLSSSVIISYFFPDFFYFSKQNKDTQSQRFWLYHLSFDFQWKLLYFKSMVPNLGGRPHKGYKAIAGGSAEF